ncbi:hypothetical protein [Fluviicola taffensis]|uniref:hypothetical protein n=1 Tax=Fluviicola taffensis TaxID=191579 RepID=UPI0031383CFA
MKTFDENGNERKAQDIRYSVFLYMLKSNDFDLLLEQSIETKIEEVKELQARKIDLTKDFKVIVEEILTAEKIKILAEMKIIYAYKTFESALKHILSNMYSDFESRKASGIDKVSTFLSQHGVELSEIENYFEVDQLRRVNNSIKHSNILETDEIENIIEFTGKDLVEYNDILIFYQRVSKVIPNFFDSLRKVILSRLQEKNSHLLY